MNSFILLANGQQLDTNENEGISLNYQIDDIFDPSKRKTNWSQEIDLPSTPTNNLFFKHIFDVYVDASISFNAKKAIPASIRIGDDEVFKNGFLQLIDIISRNGERYYSVSIAGSITNIYSNWGDFNLNRLNLSEYNHIRNKDNITNSWDYTCKVFGDDVDFGQGGTGYIYGYAINGNSTDIWGNVYIYDLFPNPYLKTVVDKMFEFAGFTYTSEFLNSPYFKKLVLQFVGDKLQMTEEVFSGRTVFAGVTGTGGTDNRYVEITPVRTKGSSWYYNSDTDDYAINLYRESGNITDADYGDVDFTDYLDQWYDGHIFINQNTGRYNVNFDGKVVPKITHQDGDPVEYLSGEFEFIYYLILIKDGTSTPIPIASSDGTVLFTLTTGGPNPTPWYDDIASDNIPFSLTADNLFLEEGDRLVVRFGFRYPDDINWQGLDDNKHFVTLTLKDSLGDPADFTKMVVEPASNDSMGLEDVDMNQMLPDMKMSGLMNNLINAFNLIVMDNPNKANDLIVEPKDAFFASKQKILDWTYKLDLDSEIKDSPMSELDFKSYKFTYSSDDDYFNKQYTDETKRVFGDLTINVLNDFSDKDYEIKLDFAPTVNASLGIGTRVAPFFTEIDGNAWKPKKVKPRILFYGGLIAGYPSLSLKDSIADTSPYTTNTYPYIGMWSHPNGVGTTDPIYSLEFGQSDKQYFNTPIVPHSTLYEQFHKATIQNIIDPNARLLEASFWLTPKDIAEFDFRDVVFMENYGYWRVQKIENYNPVGSESLTKVVLIKLVDINILSPYTVDIPTSNKICPDDILGYKGGPKSGPYYASRSGQPLTEDCCRAINGYWVDGICKATSTKPTFPSETGVEEPAVFNTGQDSLPTSQPSGPKSQERDGNTINTLGIPVQGTGNYIPKGAESTNIIIGNNNALLTGVEQTITIGNGITISASGVVQIGQLTLSTGGTITGAILSGVTIDGYLPLSGGSMDSGSTLSADTIQANNSYLASASGSTIYSGGTPLELLFLTSATLKWSGGTGSNSIVPTNGISNTANGDNTLIQGNNNTASQEYGVTFGRSNINDGAYTYCFGENNENETDYSAILGGYNNLTTGQGDVILGGNDNQTNDGYSTILNGTNNIGGFYSLIGGGTDNITSGSGYPVVLNGNANEVSGAYGLILNGDTNLNTGAAATIINGLNCIATGTYSIVAGSATSGTNTNSIAFGVNSKATGTYSTTINGLNNTASGSHSFVQGSGNTASGINTVVMGGSGMNGTANNSLYTTNARLAEMGGVIYSGGTPLHNIFATTTSAGTSANLWSAGTATGAIRMNNSTNNQATGIASLAVGSGNTASGLRTVVLGGANIVGNVADTVYVPHLIVKNTSNFDGSLYVDSSIGADGNITTFSSFVADGDILVDGIADIGGDIYGDSNIEIIGSAQIGGALIANTISSISTILSGGTDLANLFVKKSGNSTIIGELSVTDNFYVNDIASVNVLVATGTTGIVCNGESLFTGVLNTESGIAFSDGGVAWKMVEISIGDWDMSSSSTVSCAHGQGASWKNIRDISVVIRRDDDAEYYDLLTENGSGVGGAIDYFNSTNIVLERSATGGFNNTNFNSTSYNRGYITFWVR